MLVAGDGIDAPPTTCFTAHDPLRAMTPNHEDVVSVILEHGRVRSVAHEQARAIFEFADKRLAHMAIRAPAIFRDQAWEFSAFLLHGLSESKSRFTAADSFLPCYAAAVKSDFPANTCIRVGSARAVAGNLTCCDREVEGFVEGNRHA